MSLREARILKTLLNRYDQKDQEKLLSFLQVEDKQTITSQEINSYEIAPLLFQHQHILERLHYSWLKPILKQLPNELMHLFVSSLSPSQVEGLKTRQLPNIHLSSQIKLFMRSQVFRYLDIDDLLPVEFLPPSEFSYLLNMEKTEMMTLFDFLGLHDLAAEVRRMVNPVHLKNIYTSLTPKQFHYLKICINQKEKLVSPPLGIDVSMNDSTLLKQLIHKRGLIRLGKALCGQHKDFIWYVAHTLDTGRGKILLNQYQPIAISTITSFLQLQVINVINFLKKE